MATLDKDKRILVIVESPHKAKTFTPIFKELGFKKVVVMASVGHIRGIANEGAHNLGIDIDGDFKATYEIDADKKEVVSKLKEQAKAADMVLLLTDPDREGEAISWHLKEVLKLPKSKYYRTTVHAINKAELEKALKNLRDIDLDYVAAALTRQKEDKITGFLISEAVRNAIGARSAGRCQTPGVGLIVEREKEIENFVSDTYYDFYLHFSKNGTEFKAKYQSKEKLTSLEQCQQIAEECKKGTYVISSVTKKESMENPKPAFKTTDYQKEVARKLKLSVDDATKCSQSLYEGIQVGNQHVGLVTYIRTDSTEMAPEFLPVLKDYIENMYGPEYYAPAKAAKKKDNDQDGHEALRAIDLNITPKVLRTNGVPEKLVKVYEIIWKRTIAASMKPAVFSNTIYTIKNGKHEFILNSKELIFDGFKKVYEYGKDEDEEDSSLIRETFVEREKLQNTSLEAIEKHTNPPARYDEAAFVGELERREIGRPSTTNTILKTVSDASRGYVKEVEGRLVPTDLGIKLWEYAKAHFNENVGFEATARMEKQLDEVETGQKDSTEVLAEFQKVLNENLAKVMPKEEEKVCPKCGKPMKLRKGKYGYFYGCTGYPKCSHIIAVKK